DYGENPEKVKKMLLDVAEKHPLVLEEPAPVVRYNYSKDSAITMNVRLWCKRTDYWTVNFDLNEQLTKKLIDKGVQIPFPQVTVSYRKEGGK
ncbi:MAG: mechanosensitive ion channel, partial [Spirochaetales bacterium]|nr:mechanosensitive ion channel [Spirochaetales bacterium]